MTPLEAKGFVKGLAEPVVWLGLEDFRGLVGADQFPLRIGLIRIQSVDRSLP
jgi:hypothetical protein